MTKEEIILELQEMNECGCSVLELWNFIEENTDLDPILFTDYLV